MKENVKLLVLQLLCVKHLLTEILCVIDENIKQENLNQSRDLVSDKPGYQKILHEFWVDQEFPKTNGSFLKMTIKLIICTFDIMTQHLIAKD